jgi:hypothetical protein
MREFPAGGAAAPRRSATRRRVVSASLAVVLLPALVAVLWFTDWRTRLAHTRIPPPRETNLLFSEADSLIRQAQDAALAPSRLSLEKRVRLSAGLAGLLMVADQLDDIQTIFDLAVRRLPAPNTFRDAGRSATATTEPGATATPESWVYDNLARGVERDVFFPHNDRSKEEYLTWTAARRGARSGLPVRGHVPAVPAYPFGPDTSLSPSDATEALVLRESALAVGLAGRPLLAIEMLKSVQVPFSCTFEFGDPRTSGADGWALRLLRYPDARLSGDMAAILRRAVLSCADSIWLSVIPKEGEFGARLGEPFDPEVVEGFLRWRLACAHAAAGDSAWFLEHAASLRAGPPLYHHWTRLLARQVAGLDLPEPGGSEGSLAEEIVAANGSATLQMMDRAVLAERLGVREVCGVLPKDPSWICNRLDPVLGIAGIYDNFLPFARALAMAYPADDRVFGPCLGQARKSAGEEGVRTEERWLRLLESRIYAARDLGALAALSVRPSGLLGGIVTRTEIMWDKLPWNLASAREGDTVRLVDYVIGLHAVWNVIRYATPECNPSGAVVNES